MNVAEYAGCDATELTGLLRRGQVSVGTDAEARSELRARETSALDDLQV